MIKLIYPKNNQTITTLKSNVVCYFNAMYQQAKKVENDYNFNGLNWSLKETVNVDNFVANKNYVIPAVFKFENNGISTLILSLDKNFNKIIFKKRTKKNVVKVYNLLRNTIYYWKVVSSNESSCVRSFKIDDLPRCLKFGKAPNIRDFGGWKTQDGRTIKQGLLIRGCELTTDAYKYTNKSEYSTDHHPQLISKKGCHKLSKLLDHGIEIDLRGDEEANYQTYSELDSKNHRFDYKRLTIVGYDRIFETDFKYKENIKKMFELVANADKVPIYCHCWGGADRTGTFCFLLGALLGMSYTDLIIDYELSSFVGNRRVHYKENHNISWLRFPEFYEYLENYSKKYKIRNISRTVEKILINEFNLPNSLIKKAKSIFLL